MESHAVYILASKRDGVLYIGKSSDLPHRVSQHKSGLVEGFTKKYNIKLLVYYEVYENHWDAAKREALLKKWKRDWKIRLIEEENPLWEDLYAELF